MLGGKSRQLLSSVYGKHRIPAFGKRERHLPRATPNLEDTAIGGERRKGNDLLNDLLGVARPHLVIDLGDVIELTRQRGDLGHLTRPPLPAFPDRSRPPLSVSRSPQEASGSKN